MADAGIALNDIRDAFAGAAVTGADSENEVAGVLVRLEDTLAARAAELQKELSSVQRMRTLGSRLGLLDDLVSSRLEAAPEGALRQDDLDALLVTEQIFGPLGSVAEAGRFLTLALHPRLRAESDRVDAAEEALDDTVAVDAPRVEQVAAERHAFETALMGAIEESGQLDEDDALFDSWDELHPPEDADPTPDSLTRSSRVRSAAENIWSRPYDFSPARLRSMELAVRLGAVAEPTP